MFRRARRANDDTRRFTPRPSLFLLPLGVLAGLAGAIMAALRPLSFDAWLGTSLLVCTVLVGLGAGFLVRARARRRKERFHVAGEVRVRGDGLAFLVWFAVHNLVWVLGAGLAVWVLLRLFGPTTWVAVAIAGLTGTAVYALLATLLLRTTSTLGLCWRHGNTASTDGFLDSADAAMVLPRRYRAAVADDDEGQTLSAIARTLDLARVGGAERAPDLWTDGFAGVARELRRRFEVLGRLCAVVVMSGVLVFVLLPELNALPAYRELARRGDLMRQTVPSGGETMVADAGAGAAAAGTQGEGYYRDPSGDRQGRDAPGLSGDGGGASGHRDGRSDRRGDEGGDGDQGEQGSQHGRAADQHGDKGREQSGPAEQGQSRSASDPGNKGESSGLNLDSFGQSGQEQDGEGSGGEGDSGDQSGEGKGQEGESGEGGEGEGQGAEAGEAEGEGEGQGGAPSATDQVMQDGFGLGEVPPEGGAGEGMPGALPPGGSLSLVELELPPLQRIGEGKPGERREPTRDARTNRRARPDDIANRAGRATDEPDGEERAKQPLPNWIRVLLSKRDRDDRSDNR